MVITAIFIISLVLRLTFMSPWLEDWDSVQFALATQNFDLASHLPHPPGYAAYIFLGRLLGGNLTLLSVLLGAATVIPFYFLARQFSDKKIAFLTTILFAVTPIHWVLSEVALSNVPGMFFAVTSVYFIYRGRQSKNFLLAGSFLAGLTLGVRFAEYSILIPLIILTAIQRKSFVDLIKSGIYFSAGVLIWLVPTVIDTGLHEFIRLYQTQAVYIANHDAVGTLGQRLAQIWQLFLTAYTPYFLAIVVLAIISLKHWCKNLFLWVWLFAYLIPLIFVYNLEVPRHILPLLPPLLLLPQALKSTKLTLLIYLTIIILIFPTALKQMETQKNTLSPTIAPVLFVKENFDASETTLVTTFTYRQFQYYAPDYLNYWGSENTPETITTKYVITDSEELARTLPSLSGYNIVDEANFFGDKRVFPRISEMYLFVLERQ